MNTRVMVSSLATLLGCALAVSAQTTPPAGTPTVSLSPASLLPPRPAESAISFLNKRVDNINWVEKPLEEVMDWFREEAEGTVDVMARWTALSVETIDKDSLVTLSLRSATIAEVLQEVLDLLSEDGALGFHAYNDKLKISTRADFDKKMYLRTYDATDILFPVRDMGQEAPQIDLQNTQSSGGGGGGGGGQSVFSGAGGGSGGSQQGGEQAEQEFQTRLKELATLIQNTIAPESWAVGQTGGKGRINVFNRALIVLATIEVHETIQGTFSFDD